MNTGDPERYVLTPAEEHALRGIRSGLKPHQIARQSGISIHTVRAHLARLRMKYGATTLREVAERVSNGEGTVPIEPEVSAPDSASFAEARLKAEREFQERLGPERAGTQCRHPGCQLGAVAHSVMCGEHHMNMLAKAARNGAA